MQLDLKMTSKHQFVENVSRRDFLKIGLTTAGGLALQGGLLGPGFAMERLPTLAYRLLRDTDFLNVEVRFINFERKDGNLLPLGLGQSSVAVIFPPQNLAEAIFDERHAPNSGFENDPLKEAENHGNSPVPPVSSFISGPSWVVFDVPDHMEPFKLDEPESWWPALERLSLRVPRGAIPPTVSQAPTGIQRYVPQMPTSTETALEIPFRLYISPGPNTRFSASALSRKDSTSARRTGADSYNQLLAKNQNTAKYGKKPSKAGILPPKDAGPKVGAGAPPPESAPRIDEPVELWNASLTSRDPVKPAGLPPGTTNIPEELAPPKRVVLQARAVYSPDYQRKSEPRFSLYYPAERPLSLHALTRHRLVRQMSEGDGQIDIEHLVLTAMGADANFYYASQKTVDEIIREQIAEKGDPGTELRMWKHRIVIGRDVFFVEAFFGFLFPFCHPSIYVELTQRKFVSYAEGTDAAALSAPGAYLLKRRFILVQDPLKNYAGSDNPVGRMMPAKRVTLRTVRSPDLADPAIETDADGGKGLYFWPRLETTEDIVKWETEVEDESGQKSITPDARLWFASNIVKGHRQYGKKVAAERTIPFPSSKIAFAPEKGPSTQIALAVPKRIQDLRKNPPISLDQAKQKINQAAKDALGDLDLQTKKIADVGKDLLDKLGKELDTVTVGVVDDVLHVADGYVAKLKKLNELGATLETKAITFTSNFVQHEVEIVDRLISELAKITKIEGVDQLIKNLHDGLDVFADKIDEAARHRIADALGALIETSKAIEKDADKALADFRAKSKEYLAQYQKFRDEAAKFGSGIFHTGIEAASVVIPAVKGMLPDVPEREIKLVEDYITGGFRSAQNGVYAKLTEAIGKAEDIGGQIKNGLAKPSTVISGISRELGAVASQTADKVKEIARTDFNKFTNDLSDAVPDAKVFGVIPLRKIIAAVGRGQMPDINVIELPEKIERNWSWAVPVKRQNFGILTFAPVSDITAGLIITSKTTVNIPKPKDLVGGAKPQAVVTLDAFLGKIQGSPKPTQIDPGPGRQKTPVIAINLLDLLEVQVAELRIQASYTSGQPIPTPTVKPILASKPVKFLGPLAFLGALQNGLSFGGLDLGIDTDFIHVKSSTTIPPIAFGAFSCRNLALKSGLALPLGDRTLRYEFAFSSFEKPFELSVMGFAGRGYFSAAFESNGNRELIGALEFGGALSFDIGIASGGLYVMAGGYLKITNSSTELAGYLRAGGQLDVLGLVHVCVEFFLALAYRRSGSDSLLYGYCEITVSIDVTVYSYDVHLGMEKTIAGSKGQSESNGQDQPQGLVLLDAPVGAETLKFVRASRATFVPANAPDPDQVRSYFPTAKDKAERKKRGWRFEPANWESDYWAKFDYSRT
ncbi:hypothetical protein LQG66_08680 [Bradyrhizobium ontarionense]|uniref:Uncharacterized protein n=1 Tax=Bradyrhizobium ontarionense TaxID=2898149 RepID=A0ABY3RFX4_9BRAD|nr:hypothetical protein [Bradyrhizobium sp. A19]UFZ06355.1 hypothetical protein LQG66_08680 [Bradyrhizobium sp. A19]